MKYLLTIGLWIGLFLLVLSCNQKPKKELNKAEESKTPELITLKKTVSINYILTAIAEISRKSNEIEIGNEYGAGDCFGSFKKYKSVKDTMLLTDNFDCGDYGFTNLTYLIKKENKLMVRKIKKEWVITDSIPYFVQEWLYNFSDSTVYYYRENRTDKYEERFIPESIHFDTIQNELAKEFELDFEKTIAKETAELIE